MGLPDEYWARFEKCAGIYVIFDCQIDAVHNVGMSRQDTGNRLYQWVFKENKIDDALSPNDLILSVVLENHWYMSPALESYLIDSLKPSLNSRR